MIDSPAHIDDVRVPPTNLRTAQFALLCTVCAVVIGLYAWIAKSGWLEWWGANAENSYYNQLVQGFRTGQFNLKRETPSELAQQADPYDPKCNGLYLSDVSFPYPLYDLSYYHGKLYLYFGVTPALVLFWPYAALTGHYLFHKSAVLVFCTAGFLSGVGLLWGVRRRYFVEVSVGVVVAAVLAVGLSSCTVLLLARSDVHEVAISCGYALTMLTLTLLWRALHSTQRQAWWLAGASLAYALVLGARPSLLFGAVILFAPVFRPWRERVEPGPQPGLWTTLLAATAPITIIGLGLLLYNFLRFGNPLEFGHHYALCGERQDTLQHFSPRFLWYNFRVYFLEPALWSGHFPFVHDIQAPALPAGHATSEHSFGVLSNVPLAWVALAAPLVWRGWPTAAGTALRRFVAAIVLLFVMNGLILNLFQAVSMRYQVEFLPALMLLAVLGILGLERALTGQPVWRGTVRWAWGLLLAFSVSFNCFAIMDRYIETHRLCGIVLFHRGQVREAMVQFEKILMIQSDNSDARASLGLALLEQGKVWDAIWNLQEALRLKPDFAEAQNNLGAALFKLGRVAEAVGYYEQALRLEPTFAEAEKNLGIALLQQGKTAEGIAHLEQATRLAPNDAHVHFELGKALLDQANTATAIGHLEEALRLQPDHVRAHNSLAVALVQEGRVPAAIDHLEQALRLKPDFVEAHDNLGMALLEQDKGPEAIGHFQQALRLRPDDITAYFNLATVLLEMGRVAEAVAFLEQALRLRPEHIGACRNLAWVLATCRDGKLRNGARAVELAQAAERQVEGKDPMILDALAAAYAEMGRFEEAVRTGQAAFELLQAAGRGKQAEAIEERLKLYRAGQPYREGATAGVGN